MNDGSIGMCDRCTWGRAFPQECPGDGATHHHGRVHVKAGGLQAVCDGCLKAVWLEWNNRSHTR